MTEMPFDPRDAEPDEGAWECPVCFVRFSGEEMTKVPEMTRGLLHAFGCPERAKAAAYLEAKDDDSA
jgi:hypothetical protein